MPLRAVQQVLSSGFSHKTMDNTNTTSQELETCTDLASEACASFASQLLGIVSWDDSG